VDRCDGLAGETDMRLCLYGSSRVYSSAKYSWGRDNKTSLKKLKALQYMFLRMILKTQAPKPKIRILKE
jgi:hypothetical protein